VIVAPAKLRRSWLASEMEMKLVDVLPLTLMTDVCTSGVVPQKLPELLTTSDPVPMSQEALIRTGLRSKSEGSTPWMG
jgi:hypothetical protein